MHVLADDLTSALDALAPLAARGADTEVLLNASDRGDLVANGRAVAVDLDSRFADPNEARARFRRAAARVASGSVVLKTVDSTLRGNVAAEIAGALQGSGRTRAIVAPAFPAAGRTTVAGRQLVGGVPVDRSAFADDPRTPCTTSVVAALLPRLGGIEVRDAATDADLDTIVAAEADPASVLWIGSPGLAAALARRLAPVPARCDTRAFAAARVLTVVGSAHPTSRSQAARLAAACVPTVAVPTERGGEARAVEALRDGLSRGVACLAAPTTRLAGADAVVGAMARLAAQVRDIVDGVVATGGDTASHVLLALGAERLRPCGEVEPGVPYGVARSSGALRAFAIKAGGFGGADTLAVCVARLRSGAASQ